MTTRFRLQMLSTLNYLEYSVNRQDSGDIVILWDIAGKKLKIKWLVSNWLVTPMEQLLLSTNITL
jgi:hypothetical protein